MHWNKCLKYSCGSAFKGFKEKRTWTKTGTGFVYDPSTGQRGGQNRWKCLIWIARHANCSPSLPPPLISLHAPLHILLPFFLFEAVNNRNQLTGQSWLWSCIVTFWWSNLTAIRPSKAFGKHSKREQWEQESGEGKGGEHRAAGLMWAGGADKGSSIKGGQLNTQDC